MPQFSLVLHNHQPVGNFVDVIDSAVALAYQPFLELLLEYPSIKATFHFSGPLLYHLRSRHPKLIDLLGQLLHQGKIDLLSSGIGEPILTAIPARDRREQVRRMNELLINTFDYRPRGIWLTERVFDPCILPELLDNDIEFLLVDDGHLYRAGLADDCGGGPFRMVTEAGSITIFSSDSHLRHFMPYDDVERILRWLAKQRTDPNRLLVVGDDGEKFGDWPGTNALCYGNGRESGWLHRFFEGLEDLSGELKTVLLCDEAKKTPLVQCDVPAGSYHEMNQWAGRNRQFSLNKPLSLSEAKRLQPAIWTNYLRRYREAGHLFGKMNQLSRDIARIADPHFRQKAEADLFDAQCNCAYWHGVFGGIYLPHLRIALHEKMISARKTVEYYFSEWLQEISNKEAEYAAKKQMDQFRAEFFQENYQSADLVDALYTYPKEKLLENRLPQIAPCICKVDYDHDGDKEIILRNKTMEVALDPKEGGSLFSLDFFPRNYPAAAVMSRIEEDYHKDFTGKLPNKQKTPPQVFDPWRRASFRDHVFSSVTLDELVELRYTECGSFANAPYTITKEDTSTLQLVHKGQIKPSTTQLPLTIKKEYSLEEDTILINYQLEYGEIPTLFFSPEINLLTMSTEGDRFLEVGKDRFSLADCRTISASKTLLVRDDYLQVGMEVSCSLPIDWHYLPIQSISRNFDQFEAIHQGFSLWPLLPIGEKNMNSTFTLRIRMTS